ncbi:MAG: VanZ family protein [Thermoanaerobaculia bacterium]
MVGLSPRSFRLAAWAWALLTAVLLLMPGSEAGREPFLPPLVETILELVVHFVLFLVLAWLTTRAAAVSESAGRVRWQRLFVALVAYCVALELGQLFVPLRHAEPLDLVFGCLGIWLGARAGRARPDR